MSAFDNATLMITGGTGSFGSTVLKHFLDSDLKLVAHIVLLLFVTSFRPSIRRLLARSSSTLAMSAIPSPSVTLCPVLTTSSTLPL